MIRSFLNIGKKGQPKRLQLSEEQALIDSDTGDKYSVTQPLTGRGQDGFANFYGVDGTGPELLIKEDDPATCLLEGTAYFIERAGLVPASLSKAANFASAGTVVSDQGEKAVSIQSRVIPTYGGEIVALDNIVFGRKRNPKTLWSEESWYPDAIKTNVGYMGTQAQWQLAAGIYGSQLVGDESLHVAQFMAEIDENKHVVGVTRIDFGARERYAEQRQDTDDLNPNVTSKLYSGSGQGGKDYLGYLLANADLQFKQQWLWVGCDGDKEEVQDRILEASQQAFIEQFANIPDSLKEKALQQVLATINKSARKPFTLPEGSLDEKVAVFAEHLASLDVERAKSMTLKARERLNINLDEQAQFVQDSQEVLTDEMMSSALAAIGWQKSLAYAFETGEFDFLDNVEPMIRNLHDQLIEAVQRAKKDATKQNIQAIDILSKTLHDTLESAHFVCLKKDDYELGMSNEELEKMLTAVDTVKVSVAYHQSTSTKIKQHYSRSIMELALTDPEELSYILQEDEKMLSDLKAHKGVGAYVQFMVETKTAGHLYLTHLYHHNGLSVGPLNLTENQQRIHRAVEDGDFQQALDLVNDGTYYDAVAPDEYGETALHKLMKTADARAGYDAIVAILAKSIGKTKFTSMDLNKVVDGQGNTPLHSLFQNPNKDEIVAHVNSAKALKFYTGRYKLNDLLNNTVENKAGERPDQQEVNATTSMRL